MELEHCSGSPTRSVDVLVACDNNVYLMFGIACCQIAYISVRHLPLSGSLMYFITGMCHKDILSVLNSGRLRQTFKCVKVKHPPSTPV